MMAIYVRIYFFTEGLSLNNAVKKLIIACQRTTNNESTDVKIITQENDPVKLRLFEAFYIRKYKPELNSREEYIELKDLLF